MLRSTARSIRPIPTATSSESPLIDPDFVAPAAQEVVVCTKNLSSGVAVMKSA